MPLCSNGPAIARSRPLLDSGRPFLNQAPLANNRASRNNPETPRFLPSRCSRSRGQGRFHPSRCRRAEISLEDFRRLPSRRPLGLAGSRFPDKYPASFALEA
jgi:hypothetical protein